MPSPDDVPGYELLGSLGGGAGAQVYRARELSSGKTCALRVLRTFDAASGAEAARQRRFLEDGTRLLGVTHQNVARALDVGASHGCAWIAQELVDGVTLQALLDREQGPLPLDAALGLGVQLARALEALAQAEVTHRDVSPGNIMVSRLGDVRLCAFGVGAEESVTERLSAGSVEIGAIDFLSPEQVEGEVAPTPKSDVYGLGATLYRVLAGRTPHSGSTLFTRLRSIAADAPPDLRELNPTVPDAVAAVVARLMERDSDDRPLSQDTPALLGRVATGLGLRATDWERAGLATLAQRATQPARAAAAASGQSGVVVRLTGTDRTVERALAQGEAIEVGRSAESALSLPFGWISRRHARIERRGDGVVLIDLGSANGSTVNRVRVGPQPLALRSGDLLAFGKSRFEVSIHAPDPTHAERRCSLCDQGLAADAPAHEALCARCRREAESDRAAAGDRIERALAAAGLDITSRIPSRGPIRRFVARGRGRAMMVAAVDVGARVAEALAAESQRARDLDHPSIAPITSVEVRGGVLLTVGPAIDARPLDVLVAEQGPLGPAAAARLGRALCDGLVHASERGVVRALVRPDLVLLGTDPRSPRLLDVGLSPALLEACRARVGLDAPEPCYEAPEVTDARTLSPRALVYAVGATLSFALTGNPVAEVHAGERFDRLPLTMVGGIPRHIAYLLARATSPDPAERPAAPGTLRGALEAVAEELAAQGDAPPVDDLDEDETTREFELDDLPPRVDPRA